MIKITTAELHDCREILELQKLCWMQESEIYNDFSIPPLKQTLEEMIREFGSSIVLKAAHHKRIVVSVRASTDGAICFIGRLIVHPDYQNKGIGAGLMNEIERRADSCKRYKLFTGEKSLKNLHLYKKLGYEVFKRERLSDRVYPVYLEKRMSGEARREVIECLHR
jgi:GNAT superfamily N-acetyltransferase